MSLDDQPTEEVVVVEARIVVRWGGAIALLWRIVGGRWHLDEEFQCPS